jgi:hypothetical protein
MAEEASTATDAPRAARPRPAVEPCQQSRSNRTQGRPSADGRLFCFQADR